MPVLDCEGAFEVVLPDGWTVTGVPGSDYDLLPPEGDFAITISVYPRRADVADSPKTAEQIRSFAAHVGVTDGTDPQVVTVRDGLQERSFARFNGGGRHWFAGFLDFAGVPILVSSNSDDEPSSRLCEQIIVSIHPWLS